MARLPELTDRDALPTDAHDAFDSIVATRGRVGGLFAVLMNSPEIAGRTAHFGTYIRFEKSLPQPIHELAMIVGAHECDGQLEWNAHSKAALEAGVSAETVAAIEHDRSVDGLPEQDALVINLGRQLLRDHKVDDALFNAAHQLLGDRGVVDLIATLGYQAYLGCILNGLEIQPTT